jgi:mannosyltransferase OCH1-like enzyme
VRQKLMRSLQDSCKGSLPSSIRPIPHLPICRRLFVKIYASYLNPEFDYHFHGDSAIKTFIDSTLGNSILNIYHSLYTCSRAARSGHFRFLCLYVYGGIYLYVKAATTSPLREVLAKTDAFIFAHSNQDLHLGWEVSPRISLPEGMYQQCFHHYFSISSLFKSVIKEAVSRIKSYFFSLTTSDEGRQSM